MTRRFDTLSLLLLDVDDDEAGFFLALFSEKWLRVFRSCPYGKSLHIETSDLCTRSVLLRAVSTVLHFAVGMLSLHRSRKVLLRIENVL